MIKKSREIYEKKLRPRMKKIIIGVVIFFVVFTVFGFLGLPPTPIWLLTL